MSYVDDWPEWNAWALQHMREGIRTYLWKELSLSAPLQPAQLIPWILERVPSQRVEGDRLRLYLPGGLAKPCEREQVRRPDEERLRSMRDPRVLPIRRKLSRYWIDTFTGAYLTEDLEQIGQWGWGPVVPSMQDLARLAHATRLVRHMVGCQLEEALLFLMCDLPCGTPARLSQPSWPGGLSVWVAAPTISAKDLYDQYVALRRLRTGRNRPKRPEARTGDLIAFVSERRPAARKDPRNASWTTVLAQWNEAHPEWSYTDWASISRAYRQALERRRRLGLLPAHGRDEHGGEAQ